MSLEHPTGFEPMVSELQSLALPLGYGCSERIISSIAKVRKTELTGNLFSASYFDFVVMPLSQSGSEDERACGDQDGGEDDDTR